MSGAWTGDGAADAVETLHAAFTAWFRGTVPDDEATFARIADALDEAFTIVGPDGRLADRATLLARVRASHGSRAPQGEAFAIVVDDVRVRPLGHDLALVLYEEWQTGRGRQSTALVRRDADAPDGVRWLHVHETWLPER